jgi:signal transduction histidine kinase
MNTEADPEDNAHTVAAFWVLRACELLVALLFATVLPWQQAFAWFTVIGALGAVRWWHVNRPAFRALPRERRRQIYRAYIWVLMSFVGSACYFLYVPGNLPIQAVLLSYLLGNATLIAVRVNGDLMRTAIALCLAVAPTSLRFVIEGLQQENLQLTLMGLGGLMMTASMVSMSRAQERSVSHQYALRRRAEQAADAVATLGLAKSRFFAAVSHDLRQPVHAIGLYLEPLIALSHSAKDREAMRAIEGIRQSWRALDDLLSQVLDLTRMDSGAMRPELKPVEIAPLVKSLVMQHSAVAERAGVRIVALVPPGRFANADELMLKRVLSNLLDNAIKFSAAGGSIVVALRHANDGWRLQVRDAGIGIAHAEQVRIFDEFVQVDNHARDRRQGLGLGLAIAKRFSVLMEGSLSGRSSPGQGCCMTVRLRRVAAQSFGAAIAALATSAGQPTPLREHAAASLSVPAPILAGQDVLLVEDDSLVAGAMCQLLRSWGMRVLHVETAADAMDRAAFGQIAICDVRLPHKASGVDLALQLRRMGKRVFLLSGETNAPLRESARAHRLALLTKPVSSERLMSALHAVSLRVNPAH